MVTIDEEQFNEALKMAQMLPTIVNPFVFKDAIAHPLNDSAIQKSLLGHWGSGSDGPFTDVWKEKIYGKIAANLGMKYSKEYWLIDAGFFENKEPLITKKNRGSFLCVALEHENMSANSYEEMNKLSILNVPLKVLITYPYGEKADGQEEEDVLLKNYARQIRDAYSHVNDCISVTEKFANISKCMVVFGYNRVTHIDWKYHTFNGAEFSPL